MDRQVSVATTLPQETEGRLEVKSLVVDLLSLPVLALGFGGLGI